MLFERLSSLTIGVSGFAERVGGTPVHQTDWTDVAQALGMRVVLRFMGGDGLDEVSLQRALELEDRDAEISTAFSPSVQSALLLAWTGQFNRAHSELLRIRRHCVERGAESELNFVAFHTVLLDIWRGDPEHDARR